MSDAPLSSRPWRRLVTVDDPTGKSKALTDGIIEDRLLDPARPGFVSARAWVTEATPPPIWPMEALARLRQTIEPPLGGSSLRIITIPPDSVWQARCSAATVRAYFEAAGSPQASRYGAQAPHPYMQQTRSLDLCVMLEGEITLVLDTEEVALSAGDTVVQRGTSHAWSNRSSTACVLAISSHDALPWHPA
jgi:hypothetical protein